MADTWSPAQYERFRSERSQPFFDLLALVQPAAGMRVLDLGCGTGELTRALHERLAASATLGIDNSEAMLARARPHEGGGLSFALHDIAAFTAGAEATWDLVFSNAALQWLPDQPAVLASVARLVAPGGQLAIQVPANHDHPSHALAHAVAAESPYREALGGHRRATPVLAPEAYATLLHRLGFQPQHVRLQVYGHLLPSRADVVEWVKGTLLTDYAARLPPDLYARFLETYRERLLGALDDERPYFYPFKRILLWGRRAA
ncbi:MAG: methyltransferase domain-containing protein [Myxococcales bacterium]